MPLLQKMKNTYNNIHADLQQAQSVGPIKNKIAYNKFSINKTTPIISNGIHKDYGTMLTDKYGNNDAKEKQIGFTNN